MTPISIIRVAVLLFGLSLDIVDQAMPHTTCSSPPPGAIESFCLVGYPGWLTLLGTITLLVGSVLLFLMGTLKKEVHAPSHESNPHS